MSGEADKDHDRQGTSAPIPPASRAGEAKRSMAAHQRPDPRPMRLAVGAGALAALSVMSVGLVPISSPTTMTEVTTSDVAVPDLPAIEVRHVIRYIQLKPGEVAPPGATVITPQAPAPRVVITRISAPPTQHLRIVVTRQSGKP